MEYILFLTIIIIYSTFLLLYYRYTKDKKTEFELKLEAAKSSSNTHIKSMSYKDLMSIVNDIIGYYVNDSYLNSSLPKASTDEEITLSFNQVHKTIASKSELGLSEEIKKALLSYVSRDHLVTYIKDMSRILLITRIEQSRRK